MVETLKGDGLFSKLLSTILDLIYPEEGVCFVCDTYDDSVNDEHICSQCLEKLSFISDNKCSICGKPLEANSLIKKCYNCKKHPYYFTKAISAVEYQGIIKEAIYKYKYGNRPYMYKALGPILVQAIRASDIDTNDIDIIVPVPLHRMKIIKRGFNQSELLAKYISDVLDIPLSVNNLIRHKRTLRQNNLDRLDRRSNIKNAFVIKKKEEFAGRRVILVDDIFTTGATTDECSKVLVQEGAKDIIVVTLATGSSN